MKSIRLLTIYCCVCSFVLSCKNQGTRATLDDVTSYIQDAPDSALTVLRNIDERSLNTKVLLADYSLLLAAAVDKNYVDTSDVRIIQPAIDYYGRSHGNPDKRLKAFFYQGVLFYNGEEYDNAIVSFTRAEELVPESVDFLSIGLLYSRMSDTYNRVHNAEEEYRYISLAEETFKKGGASRYYHSTLSRKGQALMNLRRYDDAERVFLNLLEDSETPESIIRSTKEDYALLLLSRPKRNDNAAMALKFFDDVLADGNGLRNINLWASYAYALSVCQYQSEADGVFDQLYTVFDTDKPIIDIWKSAACENSGDYKDAFSLLENSLTYQDSLLNISLLQTMARAQKDYLALKNSQIQLQDKNQQMRLYFVIVILAIVLLAVYFIYRHRNEKLKHERIEIADIAETMKIRLKESEEGRLLEKVNLEGLVDSKNTQIQSLQNEIESREKIVQQLRSEYAHMYKAQFKYLGDLCETFLLASEKKDSQRIVYEKVQDMIQNISGDHAGQRRFEHMIDKSLDNLMKHVREEFPNYSEEDYRFISYIFVGFDATTLCIIFRMPSVPAVYMKKSRLKRTIQESSAKFKQDYLVMIG